MRSVSPKEEENVLVALKCIFELVLNYFELYLIQKCCGPYGAIPSFLDVVFVRAFDHVKPAVSHHRFEPLIRNNFVELQRLVDKISSSDFDVDTRAFFNVLVRCILDKGNYILDFHVLLLHADFATNQSLKVLDSDELGIQFYEVGCCVSADVKEYAHPLISID